MTILDEIKASKYKEVEERQSLYPVKWLEQSPFFDGPCVSLRHYITAPGRSGIIAEFKRKSPSKGWIQAYAQVEQITLGYMQAGASALSILTDETYFGAKKDDLQTARRYNFCPILRKDFIVSEYQVIESRAMGADAILLIAAMLTPEELRSLTHLAHQLQMEVLLEIHHPQEWAACEHIPADLVGINHRNLHTMAMNMELSYEMIDLLPKEMVKIAESGLQQADTIKKLKKLGFQGFLMGEYFMKHSQPAQKCRELIQQLKG